MADAATTPRERRHAAGQARLLRRMEREAFAACRLVVTCSAEDAAAVRDLAPDARTAVMPNGVDAEYFTRPAAALRDAAPTLLLTGTFGYGPNREGAAWFVREVLPLVRAGAPDVRFVMAGRGAAEARKALCGAGRPEVEDVDSPDDIRPCFERAHVVVVPLLAGGGTRLKILEAMAMECPVVSTTVGAEGIPLEPGVHGLLADEPAAFAGAVLGLLADEERRRVMAAAALSFVRERFAWQEILAALPGVVVPSAAVCA